MPVDGGVGTVLTLIAATSIVSTVGPHVLSGEGRVGSDRAREAGDLSRFGTCDGTRRAEESSPDRPERNSRLTGAHSPSNCADAGHPQVVSTFQPFLSEESIPDSRSVPTLERELQPFQARDKSFARKRLPPSKALASTAVSRK
jgi:hypothetical protein